MTKDDAQRKKVRAATEVDFGIGKISFGGLFQGIGSVIDLVSKMEEEGKGEVRREGGFTSPSGHIRAVYGFSVKTGFGGKPTVEPFGNVKKTPTYGKPLSKDVTLGSLAKQTEGLVRAEIASMWRPACRRLERQRLAGRR